MVCVMIATRLVCRSVRGRRGSNLITKEELLEKYNISDEFFQDADISWDDLVAIYDDFEDGKYEKYEEILTEFQKEYLSDLETAHIHSVRARVKDPEH